MKSVGGAVARAYAEASPRAALSVDIKRGDMCESSCEARRVDGGACGDLDWLQRWRLVTGPAAGADDELTVASRDGAGVDTFARQCVVDAGVASSVGVRSAS